MEIESTSAQENQEEVSWFYRSPTEDSAGVPGQGEVPDYMMVDKYKSLEEQAKGYKELSSRFGGFVGAPEDYALPEGFDDDTLDGGLVDIVKALGKEHNMSQGMFADMMGKINDYQIAQNEQAQADSMAQLGENAQERISNVSNWLNVNAPSEIVDIIAPMATTAEAVEAIEWFINKSKSSKVADVNAQQSQQLSQTEYAEMLMAKDSHGDLKIAKDPAYKAKMDEIAAQF